MKTDLPRFEGTKVEAGTARLTGKAYERIGALAKDEEIYLIVKATVSEIKHGDIRVNGADLFARQHTLKAVALVIVDRGQGERMLTEGSMLADERFGVENLFNQKKDDNGDA